MTEDEFEAFTGLPNSIEVMRGFAHDGGKTGFSWTRSLPVAGYFAHEAVTFVAAGAPRIAHGIVSNEAVIGVLLRRGEQEIVAPAGQRNHHEDREAHRLVCPSPVRVNRHERASPTAGSRSAVRRLGLSSVRHAGFNAILGACSRANPGCGCSGMTKSVRRAH
jgi:hypothetical protein